MFDLHPGSIITFLRNIRRRPRDTGAIFPSGRYLAKAIAAPINISLPGKILELGPGTGVFTQALLDRGISPDRLVLIEYNADFVRYLRRRFKGVTVLHASAFDVEKIWQARQMGPCAGIISGMPLLNFPYEMRVSLLKQCMDLLPPDGCMTQFTYSQAPSVKSPNIASVRLSKRVWFNLPPATVWLYRPEHVGGSNKTDDEACREKACACADAGVT